MSESTVSTPSSESILSFLDEVAAKANEEKEKDGNKTFDGPQIAFLGSGTTKIRLFTDPMGKLYREVVIHKVIKPDGGKIWVPCPNILDSNFKCEICSMANEIEDWSTYRFRLGIIYGKIIDASEPSDFWKPGETRAILGRARMVKALEKMIKSVTSDKESFQFLGKAVNPTDRGFIFSIDHEMGQNGGITVQLLPTNSDPVELGDWYVPLSNVFIKSEHYEDRYKVAVEVMSAKVASYVPPPAEEGNEEDKTPDVKSDKECFGNYDKFDEKCISCDEQDTCLNNKK